MSLEDFKSNVTYEKKTTYGIIGIILGLLCWGIGQPYIGIMDVVILILPAIFLALPSQTTKNSKGLAIICGIILVLAFLVLLGGYYYNPLSPILQLILCLYGFFCAYVMTIPNNPKQIPVNSSNINTNNNEIKYDKFCSKCGQGLFNDSRFCPKCGTKLSKDVQEESTQDNKEETKGNVCSECGQELREDSKFCPECGTEVTNDVQEESTQDDKEETKENVCSECGQELREDSKFCPECGTEVTNDVQEESPQDDEEDETNEYISSEVTNDNQEDSSQYETDETKENVCSECGEELDEDSVFCSECGAKVNTSEKIN